MNTDTVFLKHSFCALSQNICLLKAWLTVCLGFVSEDEILFRTFVHLSCVVAVLQSSMFCTFLCVRNVSLALSLPAPGPFHGLDVRFLLEKFCKPDLEYFL